MNLHFEDRRKLRALAQPVEPQHDLWPAIAAHTRAPAPSARGHKRWRLLALAASLACVGVLVGAISSRLLHPADHQASPASTAMAASNGNAPRWNPADPRLRGAAVELRAAQGELQQALAIAPRSAYLQQLLNGTERQQARLRHLDLDAG